MVCQLFWIVEEVEKRSKDEKGEKSKVKLHAGNASIHRRQGRRTCPACGSTAMRTPGRSAGLRLPICFTRDCNSHRMTATFLSTIPSQIYTTEVQMKWAGLSLWLPKPSALQNPYILLIRSVTCQPHCSYQHLQSYRHGKQMVIFWTHTPTYWKQRLCLHTCCTWAAFS